MIIMKSSFLKRRLPALISGLVLTLSVQAQGELDALTMSLEQLAEFRILSMPKFA